MVRHGTYDGGSEKAPAAICRKVIEAKLAGDHEIEIWGDGNQTRSFMYIDDCVKGTRMILLAKSLQFTFWIQRADTGSPLVGTDPVG